MKGGKVGKLSRKEGGRLLLPRKERGEKTREEGLIPSPELVDWSVDSRLRDGMEIELVGLKVELAMDGREDTRLSALMSSLSSCVHWDPQSSDENNTSTLITRRKPRPMGGTISWTGARNKSEPMVSRVSAMVGGYGTSSLSKIHSCSSNSAPLRTPPTSETSISVAAGTAEARERSSR